MQLVKLDAPFQHPMLAGIVGQMTTTSTVGQLLSAQAAGPVTSGVT